MNARLWRECRRQIALALLLRYASFAAMCALALANETTRGPSLRDPLLEVLPYLPWVDRINWVLWLCLYLPLGLACFWTDTRRWIHYMHTGALVSLARGVCILATQLGPPNPGHVGPGIGERSFAQAWLELISPLHVFVDSSQAAYLTQDLFFSGHTATSFLLWLYLRERRVLGWIALLAHVLITASVLFAHLHYTIDIIGAWAVTYSLFALRTRGRNA
jgi:membrane-associated phospholipid phosphatase